MNELNLILESLRQLPAGASAVLATLVAVEGSSYRRPGARLLILPDGRRVGAVSGGCLEADLCERAAGLRPASQPEVITYNTADESDAIFGLGIGCRGVLQVMLEGIVGGDEAPYLSFLRDTIAADSPRILGTVFSVEGEAALRIGDRFMLSGADVRVQGQWPAALIANIAETARLALRSDRSTTAVLQPGRVQVFVELIRPRIRLIIFGASASARPLSAIGRHLGWHVTLCDRRAAQLEPGSHPDADELLVASAPEAKDRLRLDGRCAAVIMTHNYADDLALLKWLVPSEAAYVGLLGARARRDQLIADLQLEGPIEPAHLGRLFSPVGLDIGAETPDEIALAIACEIQASLRGRASGSLRDRALALHDEGGR